jgi:hypothetical protein
MATAEIIGNLSMAATDNAVPIVGDAIQGSIQEFHVTATSQHSPSPVFYAPQHQGKLTTYWDSMLRGVVRSFYAIVSRDNAGSLTSMVCGTDSFAWDRLSLELMRIASLGTNWDGEGAEAVPPKAARNTGVLLFLARAAMEQSTIAQCTVPIVMPAIDGGVILKWVQGGRELKCIVRGDIVEVVRWRSLDGYESDGFWEIPVPRVAEHFEWLLQQ